MTSNEPHPDKSPSSPRYNAAAVDAAIRSSREKIGSSEARLIHALLKGRSR